MNPQSTDKSSESTNNLSSNVVESGTITFAFSDFTNTGQTIESGSTAYYATKSVVLSTVTSGQIPFISVWGSIGQLATSYFSFNSYADFEDAYAKNSRYWYTLTNSGGKVSLNVFIMGISSNLTNGNIVYYRAMSANVTEDSIA